MYRVEHKGEMTLNMKKLLSLENQYILHSLRHYVHFIKILVKLIRTLPFFILFDLQL